MTKASLSQSNDRKKYIDGAGKGTYRHTNQKRVEKDELGRQCDSN